MSICRHPKVLVSGYKPGITKEDFDWTVRFVKDNRKDLWIYGHFHDEQAYGRILEYIEKHPATDENVAAAHFGIFRSCREDFTEATIGLIPVDDSMSESSGLSSLAQRKKYEKDYAGFAYLWAVSIFSANISEFLYDQYEMFWENYEKTPKDTIVTCIRNFLGLFGTRLKDGGCIYHRLSATDFHSAYPFPDSEAGIGWKDGYSLLKQALIYVSPFVDMK